MVRISEPFLFYIKTAVADDSVWGEHFALHLKALKKALILSDESLT